MPRFNVTVEFTLVTEIEPEYFRLGFEDSSEVSDFEDSSYWSRKEIRSDGGTLTFKAEAEDEDAVHALVNEFLSEGGEVEDNDSVTWTVDDLKVEVEELEPPAPPMDKDTAKGIIQLWLSSQVLAEDVRKAFQVLLESL